MKQTVNRSDFHDAFRAYGRLDNFTYEGRNALFGYLESYEEDTGEEMELDVIALCCDYSEHGSALEAAEEYGFWPDDKRDEYEQEKAAMLYLQDNTRVIAVEGGGVIIAGF